MVDPGCVILMVTKMVGRVGNLSSYSDFYCGARCVSHGKCDARESILGHRLYGALLPTHKHLIVLHTPQIKAFPVNVEECSPHLTPIHIGAISMVGSRNVIDAKTDLLR